MQDRYFDAVERLLSQARDANRASIVRAATVIADTVTADGIVHVFGSGHSQLAALELSDRAGNLAGIDVIHDPGFGRAETIEGYAVALAQSHDLRPPDCMIVISTSGRNAAPIEMAQLARACGLTVIAVTAVDLSLAAPSRHSSGCRLLDAADIVLDTCGVPGDAVVTIDGCATRVGPASTVVSAAILNAVFVAAIEQLVRRGIDPPVYLSQNVDGTDDHNATLEARYHRRVWRPG